MIRHNLAFTMYFYVFFYQKTVKIFFLILCMILSSNWSLCCLDENLLNIAEQHSDLPYTAQDLRLIKQYLNFYSKFPYDKEILSQLSTAIQEIPQPLQEELKVLNDPFPSFLLELLDKIQTEASPLIDSDMVQSPNSSTQGYAGSSVIHTSSSEVETLLPGEASEQNPRFFVNSCEPANTPNGIDIPPSFLDFQQNFLENEKIFETILETSQQNRTLESVTHVFVKDSLKAISIINGQKVSPSVRLAEILKLTNQKQIIIETLDGKQVDLSPYLIYVFQKYRETFHTTPSAFGPVLRSAAGFLSGTKYPDSNIPLFAKFASNSFYKFCLEKLDQLARKKQE